MHSQQTVRQKYSVMIMKNNDSDVLRILLVNTHGFSASLLDGPWKEIYFDRTTIFIIKNVYSDVRRYLQRSCWLLGKFAYGWSNLITSIVFHPEAIFYWHRVIVRVIFIFYEHVSVSQCDSRLMQRAYRAQMHTSHISLYLSVSVHPSIRLSVYMCLSIQPSIYPIYICCIRWSGVIGSLSYVIGAHVTVETGNWLGIRYRQITVTYDPLSGQMLSWWVSKKMRIPSWPLYTIEFNMQTYL